MSTYTATVSTASTLLHTSHHATMNRAIRAASAAVRMYARTLPLSPVYAPAPPVFSSPALWSAVYEAPASFDAPTVIASAVLA